MSPGPVPVIHRHLAAASCTELPTVVVLQVFFLIFSRQNEESKVQELSRCCSSKVPVRRNKVSRNIKHSAQKAGDLSQIAVMFLRLRPETVWSERVYMILSVWGPDMMKITKHAVMQRVYIPPRRPLKPLGGEKVKKRRETDTIRNWPNQKVLCLNSLSSRLTILLLKYQQ